MVTNLRFSLVPPLSFEEVSYPLVQRLRTVEDVVLKLVLGHVAREEGVAQNHCFQRLDLPVVEVCSVEEMRCEKVIEKGVAKKLQGLVALSQGTMIMVGAEEGRVGEGLQEEGGFVELVPNQGL